MRTGSTYAAIGGAYPKSKDAATLYERTSQGKLERVTTAGRSAYGRSYISDGFRMTDAERATVQFFGSAVEVIAAGVPSSEFAREHIDGGMIGQTPADFFAAKRRIVTVAAKRLASLSPAHYRPRPAKNEAGPHDDIPRLLLIRAFALAGQTPTQIGERYGWWSMRAGKRVVPARQRNVLRDAIIEALGEMADAWGDEGIRIPTSLMGAETA